MMLPSFFKRSLRRKTNQEVDVETPGIDWIQEKEHLIYHTDSERTYGSSASPAIKSPHSIRFQVVVWYVGPVDVILGKVDMRFRVTLFWNAPKEEEIDEEQVGYGMSHSVQKKVWTMHGRQRAYERELGEIMEGSRLVYVPPLSILNAADFEILGDPEVCLVDEDEKLMKWSCLYKASLSQGIMNVASFPHDVHDLVIRFGILKHRQSGKRWDRKMWKLALATPKDTQDSIQIPYGLIVDQVKVPAFSYGSQGLQFEFLPLTNFGGSGSRHSHADTLLQVKLRVRRESSYYDKNIIPLLAVLNAVAISTLGMDPLQFGSRGQMILATAFVEIGIRMTVDARLPIVEYQIKLQGILNNLFFGLLFLVLESSFVYLMHDNGYGKYVVWCDPLAAFAEAVHMVSVMSWYYRGRR